MVEIFNASHPDVIIHESSDTENPFWEMLNRNIYLWTDKDGLLLQRCDTSTVFFAFVNEGKFYEFQSCKRTSYLAFSLIKIWELFSGAG